MYVVFLIIAAVGALALTVTGCDDGLVQLHPLSGECVEDYDCESNWCKQGNFDITFNNGLCTKQCDTQDDCYYPLGMCLNGDDDKGDFCMQGCLGPLYEIIYSKEEQEYFNECRKEYSCRDVWFGNYVCWPDK